MDSPETPASYWYYFDKNGKSVISKWIKLNENWYYFNESGHMATGKTVIDGAVYYLGGETDGRMKTGWVKLEENASSPGASESWHYFNSDARMVENQYDKKIGDDVEALRSGKEILVEDIHLKDGRVISGHARVDANRGDVVFRNDNNPHLRIHDTVFGVKVSTDIQAKLANHEVVFIPGMKVGGKTISTDLRYSDTGRPLFGNNARNYRSRLGEENPRPRQRVRRRLPSLPGAQPKGMKIG